MEVKETQVVKEKEIPKKGKSIIRRGDRMTKPHCREGPILLAIQGEKKPNFHRNEAEKVMQGIGRKREVVGSEEPMHTNKTNGRENNTTKKIPPEVWASCKPKEW